MKQKRKIGRYIFGVLLLGVLVWGGLLVKNHLDFQHKMVEIVHSKEVEKLIEEELKATDPDALTPKGKIQSYEIDDKTIEHNPMGGIMFKVIINGNKEITGGMGLRKRSEDGPIRSVGMSESKALRNLIGDNDLTYEDKRFMAALLSVKFMGKIALTKATVDQKSIKKRISSSLTELESSLDQVIGTIDSDLAGKFSNSVKEGVGRKKLELNALQEFCKTK